MLGYTLVDDKCIQNWDPDLGEEPRISTKSNNQLLKISETLANVNVEKDCVITEANLNNKFAKIYIYYPHKLRWRSIGNSYYRKTRRKIY